MATREINRIDPKSVADWFRAHPEVEPVRGAFAVFAAFSAGHFGPVRLTSCCGLSSLVATLPDGGDILRRVSRVTAAPPSAATTPQAVSEDVLGLLAVSLGVGRDYVRGFICGWDGVAPLVDLVGIDGDDGAIRAGHADGRAAYEATMEMEARR